MEGDLGRARPVNFSRAGSCAELEQEREQEWRMDRRGDPHAQSGTGASRDGSTTQVEVPYCSTVGACLPYTTRQGAPDGTSESAGEERAVAGGGAVGAVRGRARVGTVIHSNFI